LFNKRIKKRSPGLEEIRELNLTLVEYEKEHHSDIILAKKILSKSGLSVRRSRLFVTFLLMELIKEN